MKTAAEYCALAEECFQWARETHDRAVRAGYLGWPKSGSTLPPKLMVCPRSG